MVDSPKMYKTRLAKWGLYKNNREHEMKAIFSKLTDRAAVGKDSSFELRGHRVDMKDAERYFKRKGFTVRDVMSWKAAHITMPRGLLFQATALRAWEVMIDVLQEILGPTHLSTFTSKFDRLDTASSSLDLERQERHLEAILNSDGGQCAQEMLRSIALLRGLATYFTARKKYGELHKTGTEIVRRSQFSALPSVERNRALVCGYELVAEAQSLQCQYAQAAATFALLVRLASAGSALSNAKTQQYQTRSEQCLRKLSQPAQPCHTCSAMSVHEKDPSKFQGGSEPSDGIEQTGAVNIVSHRFVTRTLS